MVIKNVKVCNLHRMYVLLLVPRLVPMSFYKFLLFFSMLQLRVLYVVGLTMEAVGKIANKAALILLVLLVLFLDLYLSIYLSIDRSTSLFVFLTCIYFRGLLG